MEMLPDNEIQAIATDKCEPNEQKSKLAWQVLEDDLRKRHVEDLTAEELKNLIRFAFQGPGLIYSDVREHPQNDK